MASISDNWFNCLLDSKEVVLGLVDLSAAKTNRVTATINKHSFIIRRILVQSVIAVFESSTDHYELINYLLKSNRYFSK